MILVDNYFLAILCCVICCACWGSWANTQKMVAAKQWSFELFYWDLTVGLFLTALLGAVTLGSMGSEGRTFFQDLAVMDWSSIQYAFLGGVVWNFGNIFLTAAIAVAGMSVGFPIGVGISFGADRIFDVLNQLDLYPKEAVNGTELLFVNFGDKEAAYCLPILAKVREAGVRAEIYPDASKMKKQMGYANDKQIPFVAIVGENEMNEGKLTLKNMTTGEQSLVTPDELLAVVKA
jgi:hypothetical protein